VELVDDITRDIIRARKFALHCSGHGLVGDALSCGFLGEEARLVHSRRAGVEATLELDRVDATARRYLAIALAAPPFFRVVNGELEPIA
jgi:hypothetical protein